MVVILLFGIFVALVWGKAGVIAVSSFLLGIVAIIFILYIIGTLLGWIANFIREIYDYFYNQK